MAALQLVCLLCASRVETPSLSGFNRRLGRLRAHTRTRELSAMPSERELLDDSPCPAATTRGSTTALTQRAASSRTSSPVGRPGRMATSCADGGGDGIRERGPVGPKSTCGWTSSDLRRASIRPGGPSRAMTLVGCGHGPRAAGDRGSRGSRQGRAAAAQPEPLTLRSGAGHGGPRPSRRRPAEAPSSDITGTGR
jgi:hypothetical protein